MTPARPISQLPQWGPDAAYAAPSPADARAYVHALTAAADENFHVLTRFVPVDAAADFAAVYAFCRWADDLADETHRVTPDPAAARAESLRLLGWWRDELSACFDAKPRHPVFVALRESAQRRGLPAEPFHHLIDAFEQDQRITRYDTWEQLLGYCAKSANPVGRLVLAIAGHHDAGADVYRWSDDVCTALQLVNFWQDVRRDLLERDRVYIPRDAGFDEPTLRDWLSRERDPAARVPYIKALRSLLTKSTPLFQSAAPLEAAVHPGYRAVIRLFAAGGRAIAAKIEAAGCTTLWKRPALSRIDKALVLASGFVASRRARRAKDLAA